ncbi:MAG: flagellar biosynthesis protein FlgL [Novosphingobium sp.]
MPTVSTQAFYDRFNLDMSGLRRRADALQTSIGSGQRLGRSSDDPVAASRLRMLGSKDASAAIDLTIAARASADLMLTDSTLQSFADSVIRVKELATQAANGILTAPQRAGIATELEQISSELVRLANSRDSAGHALFGGETSGDAYAVDALGNVSYIGTGSSGDLSLGEGQKVTRGLTGPEFLNFTVGAVPTDLFTVVKDLATALTSGSDPAQSARDALGALDSGLESIATRQTVVGTRLNWIDLNVERQTQMAELRSQEEADVGGTDLSQAVSQLQQTMTIL